MAEIHESPVGIPGPHTIVCPWCGAKWTVPTGVTWVQHYCRKLAPAAEEE